MRCRNERGVTLEIAPRSVWCPRCKRLWPADPRNPRWLPPEHRDEISQVGRKW